MILGVIDIFYPEEIKNHLLESTSIGIGDLAIIIMLQKNMFTLSYFAYSLRNKK